MLPSPSFNRSTENKEEITAPPPSNKEINDCKEMMIKQLTEEYALPDTVGEQLQQTKLRLVYCLYEFLINSNRLHQHMRFPNLFVYPHIGNDEPYYDVNYHNYEISNYDYSTYCDIQLKLESYFEEIKSEFISNYLNIDDDETIDNIKSSVNGQWNAIYLVNQGVIDDKICKLFPNTTNIIEQVLGFNDRICRLNIGYVYFSIIHKGTHILPHCGVSNIKLRIQLPLIVNDHVTMKCKNVEREYREGELIILDDSFVHEVIYSSNNNNKDSTTTAGGADSNNNEDFDDELKKLLLTNSENPHNNEPFNYNSTENVETTTTEILSSEEMKEKRLKELDEIRVVLLIDINHPDLSKDELELIHIFFKQLEGPSSYE